MRSERIGVGKLRGSLTLMPQTGAMLAGIVVNLHRAKYFGGEFGVRKHQILSRFAKCCSHDACVFGHLPHLTSFDCVEW